MSYFNRLLKKYIFCCHCEESRKIGTTKQSKKQVISTRLLRDFVPRNDNYNSISINLGVFQQPVKTRLVAKLYGSRLVANLPRGEAYRGYIALTP